MGSSTTKGGAKRKGMPGKQQPTHHKVNTCREKISEIRVDSREGGERGIYEYKTGNGRGERREKDCQNLSLRAPNVVTRVHKFRIKEHGKEHAERTDFFIHKRKDSKAHQEKTSLREEGDMIDTAYFLAEKNL